MGKDQCDDGNTKNGDGCNNKCVVESGFKCFGGSKQGPDTCVDSIGPIYKINRISKNNRDIEIKFDKPVYTDQ